MCKQLRGIFLNLSFHYKSAHVYASELAFYAPLLDCNNSVLLVWSEEFPSSQLKVFVVFSNSYSLIEQALLPCHLARVGVHDIWCVSFLTPWLAELEVYGFMYIIFIDDTMFDVAYPVYCTYAPWAIDLFQRWRKTSMFS